MDPNRVNIRTLLRRFKNCVTCQCVTTDSDSEEREHIYGATTDSNSEEDEEQSLSGLHLAAARGDTEAVRSIISPVNIDVQDHKRYTPLHYASRNGHVDVVDRLLGNNANVHINNASGQTSLHLAAKSGYADIVRILIFNGANVNSCNKAKLTALHLACQNGHTSIAEILLNNHATVDVMKQSDETPFYLAAKNGHADVTDLLLSRGVCDFVLTEDKETPLHAAVTKGHTEVVEVILKHCSRISGELINCRHNLPENGSNLIESSGIQPIQLLKSDGRRLSAEIVWSKENKPVEIWEDSDERTALDIAAESVQPRMVKLLLNADRGMYSEEHLRKSFVHLLRPRIDHMVTDCRYSNETFTNLSETELRNFYEMFCTNIIEIAQDLISSSKFNVNHQNDRGQSPIFDVITRIRCAYYAPGKKVHMLFYILMLLEKGADFNLKNSNGETPLMIASKEGCFDAIQILFDWEQMSGIKLDLDARDRRGETALMKAAASYDFCHFQQITRDRDGETALMTDFEMSHVSVIRLLLKHKASVNMRDYYGFTALHAAIYEPNTNWFGLHFFCKDLRTRHFDGVDSLSTCVSQQLQLREEIVDLHRLIDWLQSHIQFITGTILSKKDVGIERWYPIQRQLSNLRIRLEVVKLLLYNDDTNVNALDFRGYTPLGLAMGSAKEINSTSSKEPKYCGATRKFHEAPLEVATVDDRGRNPLHRLVISRISDCLFRYHTPLPDYRDQEDEQFDFMLNVSLLSLKNFRDLATSTDNKRRTPLHYVAMLTEFIYLIPLYTKRNCNRMKVFFKIGSEVNAVDIYGKTPLHYAEEDELYELLVQYGADENTKDNFGYSPRDLKQLRDLVTINTKNAERSTNMKLYSSIDIAQEHNTNHVTELTSHRLVEKVRIHSQSPRPQKSSEKAVWRIYTENDFIRLNRRLCRLKPYIQHFIDRLAGDIKKRDWRFECQPTLVGSAEEETKVVISADFDVNFRLIKFSQLCEPFPHSLGPKGYFELRRKPKEDTKSRNDWEFACFFNEDHCLLTDEVNSRFQVILDEVLSDPDLWQGEHLFDWNMRHQYSSRYFYLDGLYTNIQLRLLKPIEDGEGGFLFVNISVDVAAVVHLEDWWPEDALTVGINPSVKTDGCTFVFHRPDRLCNLRGTGFMFSKTFARISFAPLESRVIKESSSLIKTAYMVCKMILYSGRGTTYQLKTCLLFCMEALNARNGNETRVEEKLTQKNLAFWVERIMFCFMEFSRHHVFPCYFMPSFRQEVKEHGMGAGQIYFKSKIDENVNKDLIPFSYCTSYDLYLDLCPDDTAIDIPVVHSYALSKNRNRDPNNDPFWERFEREDFIRLLSARRYQ